MTNLPLRMRRNCNLELRLSPSSSSATPPSTAAGDTNPNPQNQPLTIFYNGKICVCDVTEFQARAIITLATREIMEKKLMKNNSPNGNGEEEEEETKTQKIVNQSQPQTPKTPGLSMKRSLQRFLQKRKHRVQSTSPYHH